jgi:hypothetical protein
MQMEHDTVEIKSGVRFGKTTGSPICLEIKNKDFENWRIPMCSEELNFNDVDILKKVAEKSFTKVRPGHADYAGSKKYNLEDLRDVLEGSSARKTAIEVAVGSVAKQILKNFGIMGFSHVIQIGNVKLETRPDNYTLIKEKAEKSELGNGTGRATGTSGQVSITYRGMENPWGNIYKFVSGINIYGNGNMGGGQPFICSNFAFAESKNNDNYVGAGFTIANANGYISAMGYSASCDWLFLPSETLGTSALPVGDYAYVTPSLNGYRIALLGGSWAFGDSAGGFFWTLTAGVGNRFRYAGGRLVYVPTATV